VLLDVVHGERVQPDRGDRLDVDSAADTVARAAIVAALEATTCPARTPCQALSEGYQPLGQLRRRDLPSALTPRGGTPPTCDAPGRIFLDRGEPGPHNEANPRHKAGLQEV